MDDLYRERDRESATPLILLSLSSFDTIDHSILLDQLCRMGIGGIVLQWFQTYLRGHFQRVALGDLTSAPWQLSYGVSQGTILFPMLFNIYMKLLGAVIRGFGAKCHQYADDTQLYLPVTTESG